MRELVNLKDYDEYIGQLLTEGLDNGQKSCDRAFINSTPEIDMGGGVIVKAKEIVNAVIQARLLLQAEYTRTFAFGEKTLNIIYLAHSEKIPTMAVDAHMNMYMNAEFIYRGLKMNPKFIAGVLMHETLHALYNHIERSENWLAAKGKPRTDENWHDTNLAADIEVNRAIKRIDLLNEEELKEIHALYLPKKDGGNDTILLEQILSNEEYMNKLRSMCPFDKSKLPPFGPDQPEEKIETTEEWNKGYKDAWNKVAELINKYGSKGAWQKLMDAGIVNAVGEIYTNKETNDIMALEFLTVKSFEDYIIESLNPGEEEYGKTYKDGFMNAFGKLVKKLYSAMNPSDNPDGPEGPDGPEPPKGGKKLKSNLPEDELEPIEFPEQKGKKKKKGNDGDDVPEPIIGQGEDEDENEDEEDKSKKKKGGAGKGGKGKTDDELTDADRNKLADDINKRTEGGTKKVSTKQNVEYGGGLGTGSFKKEGLSDRDLKESGYSDEDIDEINKVRDLNKTKNTKARLDRERDVAKRNLRRDAGSSFIAKQMDNIEVESEKYKNIWKKILEEFMAKKTRRAGRDTPEGYNDWVNKKSISRGEYGIHHRMISQDPQDVNVYVDVSGSVDIKLLEIICKSLVIFTQEWEYSGINICPWASSNGAGGVKKIRDFYDKDENEITDEILKTISEGKAKCGGGTTSDAAISALLDCIKETLKDEEKEAKDDVHIIITDGQLDDISNFENRMSSAIRRTFNRPDVAETAPKHTFWMIYDAYEGTRKEFEEEIKEGKLIFISSEVVKNNG